MTKPVADDFEAADPHAEENVKPVDVLRDLMNYLKDSRQLRMIPFRIHLAANIVLNREDRK
jgi:hypothetical protein